MNFNFKDTLLMPFTNFDMKGNLFIKEPILIKKWEQEKIYEKILKKNKDKKSFIIHDGPPYANGSIHCGHMLNRFLKDFIIRLKIMQGYYTPFIFGWDTHGLPIENQVIKNGISRKENSVVYFRQECKKYAIKQVNIQKEQIKRLGVIEDVSNFYLTLDKEYEANQLEIFKKLALNGYIFRSLKPIFWSPTSETALAESEIEYYDIETDSIYVLFEIKNLFKNKKTFFIIWTTTPWTIPANLAICLNAKFTYGLFETEKGNFIFLKKNKDDFKQKFSFKKIKIIDEFSGKSLENIIVKHPIYNRDSIVVLDDYVSDKHGTGCVHIAPGHGLDDYNVCVKYKIKPYCPVDSRGFLDKTTGIFNGLFYEDANKKVIEILKKNGLLLKIEKIVHSYPHDWRTKKPVIFRATPQWFCSIKPIKKKILEEIKKINWYPDWGQLRMANMINEREDWCISRQRTWGVPIPIIFNEDNTPIVEEKVFDHIIQLVRKNGSDIWFEKNAKDLLPENYSNIHSPNGNFKKETDIMDVWFDSGSSWTTIAKQKFYPADLYLEGNDQYRGWFNSSLIISNIITNQSSFKNCITHGFVINEKLEKMSKSQNNAIDPINITNKYGADILRLWATIIDYKEDSKFSEGVVQQICEVYRKIRNIFKFLLGNLSNGNNQFYNPNNIINEYELLDIFILNKLEKTKNFVVESFDKYDFNRGVKQIINFIVNDLSQFYLNVTKDVLYCDFKDSLRRKQIQSVIYKITYTLMCLLTPIIPFTMDEVNNNLPYHQKDNPNLYDFPIYTENFKKNIEIEKKFDKIIKLISKINKKIEEARDRKIIRSSQEAKVYLSLNDYELINFINEIEKKELLRMLIISEIDINFGSEDIKIFHSNGEKCKRCWNYFSNNELINFDNENKVCQRCFDVLKKCK